MNFQKFSIILLLVFLFAACSGRTKSIEGDHSGWAAKIRKIHLAVMDYEIENGHYPATLDDLITSKQLQKDDLTIRRSDGSLVRPMYYPNPKAPNDALLEFDLDFRHNITANMDGSVTLKKDNQKEGEQDAPSNGG